MNCTITWKLYIKKQAHLENIVYMIKEKTVENIEERQKQQTPEKFIPNLVLGKSVELQKYGLNNLFIKKDMSLTSHMILTAAGIFIYNLIRRE